MMYALVRRDATIIPPSMLLGSFRYMLIAMLATKIKDAEIRIMLFSIELPILFILFVCSPLIFL